MVMARAMKPTERIHEMPKIASLTFPSFYAECAYRAGVRAQRSADHGEIVAFYRHGEPEPVGIEWYNKGALAAQLGLVPA